MEEVSGLDRSMKELKRRRYEHRDVNLVGSETSDHLSGSSRARNNGEGLPSIDSSELKERRAGGEGRRKRWLSSVSFPKELQSK